MELKTLFGVLVISTLAPSFVLSGRVASTQKTICSLYIRTDPTLWHYVRQRIPNHQDHSRLSEINKRTRHEILDIVSRHVTSLNNMFTYTKFDGRLEHRNYKFELQKVKIDTEADCRPRASDPNPYCDGNLNASALLNTFAAENSEDYCLAYLFTYRDFHNNHLGNAYFAQPDSTAGGICSKYKTYMPIESMGDSQVTRMSLNTGFITLLNNGKQLLDRISQYNFARHVGFSFGAQYENDIQECDEEEPDCKDNYLMTRTLQRGDSEYTRYFSANSIEKISAVLDAISSGVKRNCFKSWSTSFCGNNIVDDGEECDCGFDDSECTDRCCYPRAVSMYDREKNATAKGCTRRASTQCSPSQGPCCHEGTCQLIPSRTNTVCKEGTNCSQPSFCSGLSAQCPVANPISDSTCGST